LLSTVRPNLQSFAFLAQIPDRVIASTGFAVLTAKKDVIPQFIYYQLFSDILMNQMISRMGKGSYPSINQNDVKQLKVHVAPIDIQIEIVNKIGREQTLVDANRELIEVFEAKVDRKLAEVWGE